MSKTKSDENTNRNLLFIIIEYFIKHPAIGGSCIYIVISSIGVVYSWSLYRRFQINIFDYAEANDFLLIAFKDPSAYLTTIISLIAGALFTMVCDILFAILKKHVKIKDAIRNKYQEFTKPGMRLVLILVLFLLIILLVPYASAGVSANKIINNKENIVSVSFEKRRKGLNSIVKKGLSLIGSTEKFMFFYNYSDKNTIVIPITKIISITTDKK